MRCQATNATNGKRCGNKTKDHEFCWVHRGGSADTKEQIKHAMFFTCFFVSVILYTILSFTVHYKTRTQPQILTFQNSTTTFVEIDEPFLVEYRL